MEAQGKARAGLGVGSSCDTLTSRPVTVLGPLPPLPVWDSESPCRFLPTWALSVQTGISPRERRGVGEGGACLHLLLLTGTA